MARFKVFGVAAVIAAGLATGTTANAMPFGYGPPDRDAGFERVAGGCGPGFHPNSWGHCRPNGWGFGGGWGGGPRGYGYGGGDRGGYGGGYGRGGYGGGYGDGGPRRFNGGW